MNERMLREDHLTRTFRLLDYRGNDAAGDLFQMLGDCYPTGQRRDMLRATMRQLHYIRALAGLEDDGPGSEGYDFVDYARRSGMSSLQAGHIIARLLKEREPASAA